jgi:hypothetical protein
VSEEEDLPAEALHASLNALLNAHRVALDLLRKRVFTADEVESLDRYASSQQEQFIEAASRPRSV